MTKQEYLIDCFPEIEEQITDFFNDCDKCHCLACAYCDIGEQAFRYYTDNILVDIRSCFNIMWCDYERNKIKSIDTIAKKVHHLSNNEIIIFYNIYRKLFGFLQYFYEN